METVRMLRPMYVGDFACTGSACSYNCCREWTVTLDDETYKKYKSSKDIFRKTILRNIEVSAGSEFIANFIMDKDGKCPMLTEDGLCEIQKRMGHDYLSKVCQVYPRTYLHVGDTLEEHLALSCPEAVRLILSNQDFIYLDESHEKKSYNVTDVQPDCKKYANEEHGLEIFRTLRMACVTILQYRKYVLWMRFMILGLFLELISQGIKDMTATEAAEIANEFIKQMQQGIYDELVDSIPENDELKASFVVNSLNLIPETKKIRDFSGSAKKGLCITATNTTSQLIIENYKKAFDTHYLPFFTGKEYYLEQYFVASILCGGFPFHYTDSGECDIMTEYSVLAIKFGIIRNMLVGLNGYYKENFNDEILFEFISRITRCLEHNKDMRTRMSNLIPKESDGLVFALTMMFRD